MRGVFGNFVALLTHNAVAKRYIVADLYTWFICNTLYIRHKLGQFSLYVHKGGLKSHSFYLISTYRLLGLLVMHYVSHNCKLMGKL